MMNEWQRRIQLVLQSSARHGWRSGLVLARRLVRGWGRLTRVAPRTWLALGVAALGVVGYALLWLGAAHPSSSHHSPRSLSGRVPADRVAAVGVLPGGGAATSASGPLQPDRAAPAASPGPGVGQLHGLVPQQAQERPEQVDGLAQSELAKYPGFGHDVEADEDRFSREERQREALIARCMAERGFEYTPAPSLEVSDETAGDEAAFQRLLAQAAVDPNAAYVAELSPERLRAYSVALTGLENPDEMEADAQDWGAEQDSCTRRAFEAVPGVYAKRNQLVEPLTRLEREVRDDPRTVRAYADWSRCMARVGQPFATPAALQRDTDEDLAGLLAVGASAVEVEAQAAEGDRLRRQSQSCAQETELAQALGTVRRDYEARFVSEHQALLDAP